MTVLTICMMKTIKNIIDKIIEVFAIIALSLMVILITYQVITRYFFDKPSVYSEVLAKYIFIWLVLIVGAYVFGKREHMSIVFLKEKFNAKIQNFINLIINIITFIFGLVVIGLGGYENMLLQFNQQDSVLPVSAGVIYLALPIAAGLIMFYAVYNTYEDILNIKQARSDQ